VFPHGGPWARDEWGYHTFAQFFANRGYAVLQPNFRGSTGYGKKFLNAGNGEWGRKMQDDITWGVKYLLRSTSSIQNALDRRRLLWRLRNTCRRRVYTRFVRSGGIDRGTLESHHPAEFDSAVLGGGPEGHVCAHGGSRYPAGQEAARRGVTVELGGPDQDAVDGCARRERSTSKQARIGSNRGGAARPRSLGRVFGCTGRGSWVRQAD
jgi:Prolyl oligopeptidase family